MLETLRKGAASWIAKIFIAVLVMSFAIWGIADIFRGYGSQSLAEVGDVEIDPQDYQFALQAEMRRMSQQIGRQMTMEDARSTGLDRQVLFRLIGDAALDSHGSDLGLGISEKALAERIMSEPAFRGPSGAFDREYFLQILRASGLTEQSYIARQHKASIRRQLLRTLTENSAVPDTMVNAINEFENEARTVRYIIVPAAKAGEVGEPSEQDLKTYYESHKQSYRTPELRELGLLVVEPEALAKSITIGEDEIKAYYEANKDSYIKPEKRLVQQIPFPDKATAEAAYRKLQDGTDYMALAIEQGLSERDIDLGVVAKRDLIDPAIAKAAFSLKKGTFSAPVVGRLATAIVRVTEIEPAVETPFAQAKEGIGKQLAHERALNDILDMHDRIEDERAAGNTLQEIADKLDLSYRKSEPVDAHGTGGTGTPIADLPARDALLDAAFEGDVGVEIDPVETESQGFAWVDVLKVTPERIKPLEEVRDEVAAEWRKRQVGRRLSDFTKTLLDRLKSGETLDAVAKSLQLKDEQAAPVKRTSPGKELPQAAVAQAFVLAQGEAGSAASPDGKSRLVFEVVKIASPPPLTGAAKANLEKRVDAVLADDYFSQYLTGLRDSYGVAINNALVDQVTGRAAGR